MVPERSYAARFMPKGKRGKSKIWNGSKARLAFAAAICVAFAMPHAAVAASSNSLDLLSTKISSRADDLLLSTSPISAFDELTLTCPPNQLCTIRIEFSAQFFKLSPPGVEAVATINGVPTGILPFSRIDLFSGVFDGYVTKTFTVWRRGLSPGQYTAAVAFRLNPTFPTGSETGGTDLRTLTVQMFAQ